MRWHVVIIFGIIKMPSCNIHIFYPRVFYLSTQDLSTIRNAVSDCHILCLVVTGYQLLHLVLPSIYYKILHNNTFVKL